MDQLGWYGPLDVDTDMGKQADWWVSEHGRVGRHEREMADVVAGKWVRRAKRRPSLGNTDGGTAWVAASQDQWPRRQRTRWWWQSEEFDCQLARKWPKRGRNRR